MQDAGTTKKEFDSLEGSKAKDIVEAAPKKTEREMELERIEQDIKTSKEESAKTAMSRKYGSGARLSGVGQSGVTGLSKAMKEQSKTSTDIDTPEEGAKSTEEPKKDNWGKDLSDQVAALAQRVDATNDPALKKNLIGMMAALISGNHAALVKFKTDMQEEALAAQNKYLKTTINTNLDNYFTSKGQFDKVGMENRAASRVQKTETSSKSLDELKRQGAGSFELEDIPPRDRAALSNIIVTTVADAFKNIYGAVEGGTTQVATATSENASVRGYEQAAAMMSEDIARSQARKDKVAAINFELVQKHNGDLVKAYSEFEQRAELNERFYQTQRLNQINLEYSRAFSFLGLKQQSLNTSANLATAIEGTKNREKEVNANAINAQRRANTAAMARAYQSYNAVNRAEALERTKKLTGLRKSVENAKYLDAIMPMTAYADTNVMKLSQVSDATLAGGNGVFSSGTALAGNVVNQVRSVVAEGMPHANGMRAIQNIIVMGQLDMLPRNLTDKAVRTLGGMVIQPSTDVKALINSSPIIKDAFIPTGNSSAVSMNFALISSLSNAGANYYKNTKRGEGSVDGLYKDILGN